MFSVVAQASQILRGHVGHAARRAPLAVSRRVGELGDEPESVTAARNNDSVGSV
jgi:hypothetical protein